MFSQCLLFTRRWDILVTRRFKALSNADCNLKKNNCMSSCNSFSDRSLLVFLSTQRSIKLNSSDFSVIWDNCTMFEESYGCIISPHPAKPAESTCWKRGKSSLALSELSLLYKLGWLTGGGWERSALLNSLEGSRGNKWLWFFLLILSWVEMQILLNF